MGSAYSRKRAGLQHAKSSPQLRNGEGASNGNIHNKSTVHHRSMNALSEYDVNSVNLSCTLRRTNHGKDVPASTTDAVTETTGVHSLIGDKLCHYSRDSMIPVSMTDNTSEVPVFSATDPRRFVFEEGVEDRNRNREDTFSSHRREHLSTSEVISLRTGEDIDLMTVHELFNCLNDGTMNSYIMDPFYILILDLRPLEQYERSHIVTAQPADIIYTELVLLFNYGYIGGHTTLRDFTMVVICGESVCDLHNAFCPELKLYHELQDFGIQPSILKGGYTTFVHQYPFLCSPKRITNEEERKRYLQTYPSEIIEGCLYQGRGDQATCEKVVKDLNITHIVNVCTEHRNAFPDRVSYLNVNIEDLNSSTLKTYFPKCCEFIKNALDSNGSVLVHCNLGMSRSSTISLAYLMITRRWSLKEAYDFMKSKRQAVRPNRGFLRQLCEFEEELFGKRTTDPDDIWF